MIKRFNDYINEEFQRDLIPGIDTESVKDELISEWETFKKENPHPNTHDCYEFYSNMREKGYDGRAIWNILGDKFPRKEEF
mgnify:CR=1 FL=1